jgi:hypothetical protein
MTNTIEVNLFIAALGHTDSQWTVAAPLTVRDTADITTRVPWAAAK